MLGLIRALRLSVVVVICGVRGAILRPTLIRSVGVCCRRAARRILRNRIHMDTKTRLRLDRALFVAFFALFCVCAHSYYGTTVPQTKASLASGLTSLSGIPIGE